MKNTPFAQNLLDYHKAFRKGENEVMRDDFDTFVGLMPDGSIMDYEMCRYGLEKVKKKCSMNLNINEPNSYIPSIIRNLLYFGSESRNCTRPDRGRSGRAVQRRLIKRKRRHAKDHNRRDRVPH